MLLTPVIIKDGSDPNVLRPFRAAGAFQVDWKFASNLSRRQTVCSVLLCIITSDNNRSIIFKRFFTKKTKAKLKKKKNFQVKNRCNSNRFFMSKDQNFGYKIGAFKTDFSYSKSKIQRTKFEYKIDVSQTDFSYPKVSEKKIVIFTLNEIAKFTSRHREKLWRLC